MKKEILYSIIIIAYLLGIVWWILNIVKLCKADFEPSYKNEIIRSVWVVIPPVWAVAWFINIKD